MEQQEIFRVLGQATLKSVEVINNWKQAILHIERQEKSVGFRSSYVDADNKEVEISTTAEYSAVKAVKALYKHTSEFPLKHKDWNKAKFVVTPDYKFKIEYIWDQEWQDEIDRLNKTS